MIGTVLMMAAPFIILVLMGILLAGVLTVLKIPLAGLAAIVVFFYAIPFIKKRLDVKENYAMLGAGLLGGFTFYFIYSLDFIVLTLLLIGIVISAYVLETLTGESILDDSLRMIKEEAKK